MKIALRGTAEKVVAVAIIALALLGVVLAFSQGRTLDVEFMADSLPILFEAARLTLFVTAVGFTTGMAIGFFVGWLRTSKHLPARGPASVWVEAIRGTPLFVQILFLFSLLGFYVPQLPNRLLITGVVALTINTSGYQAEIFRGGLQSVSAGQVEAARALGMRYWMMMRTIVLPQALRLVTPPLTNEFIALLKASSLLFVLGVQELTYVGRILSFGGNLFEVYALVIMIYLIMTVPLAKAVVWLERRYRIPGLGIQQEAPRGAAVGTRP